MEAPGRGTKHRLEEIMYQREVGLSHPRKLTRRLSASQAILAKIDLYGKLVGHDGCVNSVAFNSAGDHLVSGSDDRKVMLWDWLTGDKKMQYHSGHLQNIFQAKFVPFTDDRIIVTSSADGQVRLGQVLANGNVHTKRLGKHDGGVYRLASEPGSPHVLYSSGVDGFVQHFDLRSNTATKLFCCSAAGENDKQPPNSIMVHDIAIDPRNPNHLGVGGSDEYARVYDIRKCRSDASQPSGMPINTFCPNHLIKNNQARITGLAFSNTSELLVSYNDEFIYLFDKTMGLGLGPTLHSLSPEESKSLGDPQVYFGHRNCQTIKSVSFFGPDDEYVMSGSDCGHIFIWTKVGARLVRLMRGDRNVVNHLDPHPHLPAFASCGIEKTIKLWLPMASDTPPLPDDFEKIMESNIRRREQDSQVILTPEVVMHVLRLQRRQTTAYSERTYTSSDIESNDSEMEAYVLGLLNANAASQAGSSADSGDCNVV